MSSYTFEELIESVHRRPEIWQRSHPCFCNQSRKECWVEVSKELKTHEIRLRKSWKYLVDQFRKELKINKQTKKSTPSIWAYYNKMAFMKDEITNRQVRRKIRARTNSDTPSNDSNHDSNMPMTHESTPTDTRKSIEEDSDTEMSNHDKPIVRYSSLGASAAKDQLKNNMTSNIATKSKASSSKEPKLAATKADLILRRLEHLRTEMNDDDHMFFMSILPIVRSLPLMKKLQLRGKINEWLMQMLSADEGDPLNGEDQHIEDNFDDNEWSVESEDNKEAVLSQIIEAESDN